MATVFITGTNKGVGLELVRVYLSAGHDVIGTCRNAAKADALKALGETHAGKLSIYEMELIDEASIATLATQLKGQPIDIFINNAGTAVGYSSASDKNVFGGLDSDLWIEVFRANAIGPVLLAQALHSNVMLGVEKKMVFITSKPASIADNTGGAMYMNRTCRTALNQAIKSMSIDLFDDGITLASISPGWVQTDSGGEGALINAETSAKGIRQVVASLTLEQTALFADYKGALIPW